MKALFLFIYIFAGIGVLFTYAYNLHINYDRASALWGAVPDSLRPWYGVGMIAAALGYLLASYVLIFLVDAKEALVFKRYSYNVFTLCFVLILIPSILWMPLTFHMLSTPSGLTWFFIRLILFIVALGGLLLVIALKGLEPKPSPWIYFAALLGSVLFFIHAFVLDAILWPYFFKSSIP